MRTISLSFLLISSLTLGLGCNDADDESTDEVATPLVSDATNGGTTGFYFLAPFGTPPGTFPGTFNAGFGGTAQKVVIGHLTDCNGSNTVDGTNFTFNAVNTDVAQQRYRVAANVSTWGLISENCYRVTVKLGTVGTKGIGYSDFKVTTGTATGFVKVTPGSNLTILWRIEGTQDTDSDGVYNHADNCPTIANANQADADADGIGDACENADVDGDGVPDAADFCPNDPLKTTQAQTTGPAHCGCGVADTDTDGDGYADCNDACPGDATHTAFAGICGCGFYGLDTDGDGITDSCVSPTTCAPLPPRQVTLFEGQSNAMGTGTISEVDASYAAPFPAVTLSDHFFYEYAGPLAPRTDGHFGAEISLGRAMTDRNIAVCAMNGSSLSGNWAPNGTLYPDCLAFAHGIEDNGVRKLVTSIVWEQGEADAQNESMANAYAANLATLSGNLLAEFPCARFYYTRLSSQDTSLAYLSTVRAAQESLSSGQNMTMIDVDALPMAGLHYTSAGYIQLGNLIANTIAAASPRCN